MLTATPAPELTGHGVALNRGGATWSHAAMRPVAADSVAVARILFGLLVAFSSIRFMANGWVGTLWVDPDAHLTYAHFGWVRPLPGNWMYALPAFTTAAGLAIAAGWHHRMSVIVFLVTFTWTELIDAALYLNHYWFLTLVGGLMLVLPVHHRWSLDARSGRVSSNRTVPALAVWALRAQVGVVYVCAGVAKLNPDWLFRGQPLRLWLADRSDIPVVGHLLDTDVAALLASWSAVSFDLTIVGWLLWHRSRLGAWLALVGFHVVTGLLFQIGVFPVVMGAMALIFFEPSWPQRVLPRALWASPAPTSTSRSITSVPIRRGVLGVIALLALAQVILPFRHFTEPGNVRWNEDGYYLSWRVMLTEKAGFVEFDVTDTRSGDTWTTLPDRVLTDWQAAHVATRPDLIHATALLLEDQLLQDDPNQELEIRARAWVSMNGRAAALLLDPEVDLLTHDRGDLPTLAVLPMPAD